MAYKEAYPYRFSVLDYDKSERFEAWRAEHRHHDISWRMRDVDIRNANFCGVHLDELMLGRWHFSADRIETADRFARRSPSKIRRDYLDHYYLRLSLSDSWVFRVKDKPTTVHPGQLALVDLGQPYDLSIAAGDVLMLMVPRDYLPIATAALHGVVLDHALGRLFGDYLQLLFHRANHLIDQELPSVSAATVALLNATLSALPDEVAQAQRQIDATLLNKVRWHIDRHIDSPDLKVGVLCTQVGLSRSRLYRLFEPIGGVAHYIQERRLSKVRGILQARIGPRPLIADLAFRYGFSSPVQLTRAFKRRFGYTPSEVGEGTLDAILVQENDSAKRWLSPR